MCAAHRYRNSGQIGRPSLARDERRGQEKHDKNDKGDEDLIGGEACDGMRHSARRRVLFEPAGQIILSLEIEQRHAQRFQLFYREPFDLPLDCSRRFAKPQFELTHNPLSRPLLDTLLENVLVDDRFFQ
jgi:hypothetical protein